MQDTLVRHDAILRDAVESHRRQVVKSLGDGVVAVFSGTRATRLAPVKSPRGLSAESWAVTGPFRVQ